MNFVGNHEKNSILVCKHDCLDMKRIRMTLRVFFVLCRDVCTALKEFHENDIVFNDKIDDVNIFLQVKIQFKFVNIFF